ncbi:MAG TPA: amidohydrolase family protein [Acidimicrobiia bacterium]|nr:amidohydrolase family protein [Acidimicrobiia bacterium]
MGALGSTLASTPGLVNAHHHLYSALARGMALQGPAPVTFREILERIWWRFDQALDLQMLEWAAKLAALEALEVGTTTIVDHNESPGAIEGSLTVLADACAEVGVRLIASYGVSDRHGAEGARRGLEENRRFLSEGGKALVGIHAAFTCSDETLEAAAGIAADHGVGVHVHVCEGPEDIEAPARLAPLSGPSWLLAHCVHLATSHHLQGTIVHNPASNLNNGVGYAEPSRFTNPVALGTDGIGADMLDTFRLAYYLQRSTDHGAEPGTAWEWLATGWDLVPEAKGDRVTWSYEPMEPGHLAFTTAVQPIEIEVDGEIVWREHAPTRIDPGEVRSKAAEEARRLHALL